MPQSVFPFIAYEDAGAAMDWLVVAFGFRETRRIKDDDGLVVHGELEISGDTVMVASPTLDYQGPRRHAETCEAARRWTDVPWVIDGVMVYVKDLDAHYQQAEAAGAVILSAIEKGGGGERQYRAADNEGHRWMFAERSGGHGN